MIPIDLLLAHELSRPGINRHNVPKRSKEWCPGDRAGSVRITRITFTVKLPLYLRDPSRDPSSFVRPFVFPFIHSSSHVSRLAFMYSSASRRHPFVPLSSSKSWPREIPQGPHPPFLRALQWHFAFKRVSGIVQCLPKKEKTSKIKMQKHTANVPRLGRKVSLFPSLSRQSTQEPSCRFRPAR
jgi:hypothetical protein